MLTALQKTKLGITSGKSLKSGEGRDIRQPALEKMLLFSCSVESDSLQPMDCSMPGFPALRCLPEFAQTRPLSWWCRPIISSSVTPFSFCLQFFPAAGSSPMSQLFTSSSQSIGASATASVLPMNIQGWFPLRLTSLISFLSKGCSSLLQDHSSKASVLRHSAFFMVQLSHLCMTPGKIIALTIWTFVSKVMSLLFNMLSSFVIAFPLKTKCLLISWLQSLSALILEPKKIKSATVFAFCLYLPWSDGTGCHDLRFLNIEF